MAKADWNTIRAEYIGGATSQRKLAEKYGVPYPTLRDRAEREKWSEQRDKAREKAIAKSVQKAADATSSSAITAQRIREKLLARLEKEIDALPENIGSNFHKGRTTLEYGKDGKSRKPTKTEDVYLDYRLKDLSSAWKDLTDGLPLDGVDNTSVTVIIDV